MFPPALTLQSLASSNQVREVYVHGRLEHRMVKYVDTVRGFRVPVLSEDERVHFAVDGRCFIVRTP